MYAPPAKADDFHAHSIPMTNGQSGVPEAIRHLVHTVPRAPEDAIPQGCKPEDIAGLEARTGLAIPPEMRDWLHYTNGPCIGPGGLFGIRPNRRSMDIEQYLRLFPAWAERRWLPVAGDGCGNYFVLECDVAQSRRVLFVDPLEDAQQGEVVADNLWVFLGNILEAEAKGR